MVRSHTTFKSLWVFDTLFFVETPIYTNISIVNKSSSSAILCLNRRIFVTETTISISEVENASEVTCMAHAYDASVKIIVTYACAYLGQWNDLKPQMVPEPKTISTNDRNREHQIHYPQPEEQPTRKKQSQIIRPGPFFFEHF